MITSKRLRELVTYNSTTGDFIWKIAKGRARIGDVAGTLNNGYITIRLDKEAHFAHRLAWFYVHEVWPTDEIDHIDLCRANNKIENLREATRVQNLANKEKNRNNKSGYKGVDLVRQEGRHYWRARVKQKYLGQFKTKEEAIEVCKREAQRVFREFARP